jgi:hypothetical protein
LFVDMGWTMWHIAFLSLVFFFWVFLDKLESS